MPTDPEGAVFVFELMVVVFVSAAFELMDR
jgi:hypothetical protein